MIPAAPHGGNRLMETGPEYKTLIEAEQIQRRVREIAGLIENDYGDSIPLFIALLKGAFIFMADLSRHLVIAHEIDFITLFSYGQGARRNSDVGMINHIRSNVRGRDVIIVDEIVDTGHTIAHLVKTLQEHGAASLRTCTLLDKPDAREIEVRLDYVGFRIPDVFVVGYGLDYRERFRNLACIAELTTESRRALNS